MLNQVFDQRPEELDAYAKIEDMWYNADRKYVLLMSDRLLIRPCVAANEFSYSD